MMWGNSFQLMNVIGMFTKAIKYIFIYLIIFLTRYNQNDIILVSLIVKISIYKK